MSLPLLTPPNYIVIQNSGPFTSIINNLDRMSLIHRISCIVASKLVGVVSIYLAPVIIPTLHAALVPVIAVGSTFIAAYIITDLVIAVKKCIKNLHGPILSV
jgi:hypothetical protein